MVVILNSTSGRPVAVVREHVTAVWEDTQDDTKTVVRLVDGKDLSISGHFDDVITLARMTGKG